MGIPNTVLIAIAITAFVGLLVKRTVVGRRFEAVGASTGSRARRRPRVRAPPARRYVGAALLYCAAGVLLAGVVSTAERLPGRHLPAAVGGGGGARRHVAARRRGSVVASAVAALFLSQLDQLVLTTGVDSAVQNLVEAGALAVGIAIYSVPWGRCAALAARPERRRRSPAGTPSPTQRGAPRHSHRSRGSTRSQEESRGGRTLADIAASAAAGRSRRWWLAAVERLRRRRRARRAPGGKPPSAGAPVVVRPKKITLALADGFGDNNWRRITSAEAEDEAAKCPSVTKYIYTDGQGNTQKAISDIKGLVAQGVNAMVVFPDAGKAMLPAHPQRLQGRRRHGPVPGRPRAARPGIDYDYFVSTDFKQAGELVGQLAGQGAPNGGNVVNLGGPAGNSRASTSTTGMKRCSRSPEHQVHRPDAVRRHQLGPGRDRRRSSPRSLAKYPQIDAITTDFGAALRELVPGASSRPAARSRRSRPRTPTCSPASGRSAGRNPGFQLFTVDSQNWMSGPRSSSPSPRPPAASRPRPRSSAEARSRTRSPASPHKVTCDTSLPGDAILSIAPDADEQLKAALGNSHSEASDGAVLPAPPLAAGRTERPRTERPRRPP